MIDFPSAPTTGQIFTTSAGSWQWDGTKWVTYGGTAGPTGAPNKLINPFMEIDQEREGVAVAITSSAASVDGWRHFINLGAVNAQRSTDAPPGYPNSLMLTVTTTGSVAAGSYSQLIQHIEADDWADSRFGTAAANTVSVAFWAKASLAGTYSAALMNSAGNRSYPFNFTLAANTWTLITQTIPGDTAGTWTLSGNGTGADLRVCQVAGSTNQGTANTWNASGALGTSSNSNTFFGTNGATFQLGPAGLWVAPAPQPLLRTSFQAELARCQRYYEKSYDPGTAVGTATINGECLIYVQFGGATGNSSAGITVPYKITKRASSTVTTYSPSTGAAGKMRDNVGSVDVNNNFVSLGLQQFTAYGTAASSGVANLGLHWTADARL